VSVTRSLFLIASIAVMGCDKSSSGSPGASSSSSVSATATTTATASGAASGTAAGTGTGTGTGTIVTGAYDAKLATVRTPDDAPKFDDVAQGALGAGDITLELPAGDGEVTGKASGALGAQVFRGQLEAGWLGGVLRGEGDAAMYGYLDATVTGAGDARVVTGTLRVSSGDGRVVRESAFTLKKK
jgi:hypothetical protein